MRDHLLLKNPRLWGLGVTIVTIVCYSKLQFVVVYYNSAICIPRGGLVETFCPCWVSAVSLLHPKSRTLWPLLSLTLNPQPKAPCQPRTLDSRSFAQDLGQVNQQLLPSSPPTPPNRPAACRRINSSSISRILWRSSRL